MFTLQATKQHAVAIGENQRAEVIETNVMATVKTSGGKQGQGYAAVRVARSDDFPAAMRVSSTDGVESTLSVNGGGGGAKTGLYNVGSVVRRLTPIECERLMSWPDGWTAKGRNHDGTTHETADSGRYKMCGPASFPASRMPLQNESRTMSDVRSDDLTRESLWDIAVHARAKTEDLLPVEVAAVRVEDLGSWMTSPMRIGKQSNFALITRRRLPTSSTPSARTTRCSLAIAASAGVHTARITRGHASTERASGVPGVTRTPNNRFRRPVLCPVELRGRAGKQNTTSRRVPPLPSGHASGESVKSLRSCAQPPLMTTVDGR